MGNKQTVILSMTPCGRPKVLEFHGYMWPGPCPGPSQHQHQYAVVIADRFGLAHKDRVLFVYHNEDDTATVLAYEINRNPDGTVSSADLHDNNDLGIIRMVRHDSSRR